MKVLLFGTHPKQFNGYSKVIYELVKVLSSRKDIEVAVYGFQNFYDNQAHRKDVPGNIIIYDAFANEEPKAMGFGVQQAKDFVLSYKPDICVVYNDMMVIHQIVTQLKAAQEEGAKFKICAYIDQVYLNQKKEFIEFVNKTCDFALMFTEFWEKNILEQGITLPSSYLPHGFNPMTYYPIPKHLARQFYGLKADDFIVLNLNRNQPRKRWDICMKAFAEIVSRYPNEPVKLMIATAVQGAWNLLEIYERELKKRKLSLEDGMKHLIIIDNPERITDEETNVLYNVADVGINTCDGEGFGLCQFEEAAIGIPQVVPRLGGFIDYFDDNCASLIDPRLAYYVDNTRDAVCGEALLCDYMDYVEAIEAYYLDKKLRAAHGQAARAKILKNYSWETIADKFVNIMKQIHNDKDKQVVPEPVVAIASGDAPSKSDIKGMTDEVEKIDIESLGKLVETAEISAPVVVEKKKKKLKKKINKDELKKLKSKLDKLLQDDDSSDS